MDCLQVQEALSAGIDGEDLPPGVDDTAVADHVQGCPGCRQWIVEVEASGRAWRVGPMPVMADLVERILDASPARIPGTLGAEGGQLVLRATLVVVGVLQLAVTIPVLVLGHDRESPVHVAHEMGSFGLAVVVGVIAAALRPRLAGGAMWLMGAAAAALGVTAIIDLARGVTTAADEAPHLLVVVAAALLWALNRRTNHPARGRHRVGLIDAGTASLDGPAGGLRLLRRSRPVVPVVPAMAQRQRPVA